MPRSGLVERRSLIARLERARDATAISVAAPAGYGKTTLLTQWAAFGERAFAWVTVDEFDEDPVRLIAHLIASLERAGMVDDSAGARTVSGGPWHVVAGQACQIVARVEAPFVLVLDDIHVLEPGESLDALGMIVRSLPAGAQIAICGRSEVTPIVARLRAQGTVQDIDVHDLALSDDEARDLLGSAAPSLSPDDVVALLRHTEGWAAGLYLYAIAHVTGDQTAPLGLDRTVEDYLWAEHLSGLPPDELSFLTRSAVLERMCAELCDTALEHEGSGRLLARLERSNLFLVPLGRERRWYRYHELFRTALLRQLDREEPTARDDLRKRASDWCADHGLPEGAMAYALAAGDFDRAARTVVRFGFPLYRSGRAGTLAKWFERFDDAALLERYPTVALLGALVHALNGRAFLAERWLDAGDRAADADTPAPDGSTSLRAWVAAVSSFLCRNGVARMRADAELALDELGPLSPLRPPAMAFLALAHWLDGSDDAATMLYEAGEACSLAGATYAGAAAFAEHALLALAADDLDGADASITRARELVDVSLSDEYLPVGLLHVARARRAIRAGDTNAGSEYLAAAHRLRPNLTYAVPHLALKILIELATAHVEIGQAAAARAVLVDASDLLRHRPDLGILGAELSTVRDRASAAPPAVGGWEAGLTAAELRLLPLLSSHLTFREIGSRLFISRNTVKTQAISIYRKLAVTSRSDAVSRASELGLLESLRDGLGRRLVD